MKTIKRASVNSLTTLAGGALLLALCLLQPTAVRAQWTTPDGSGNINNTNTGNVGIGTTTPTALLEVKKNQNAGITIIVDNPFTTASNAAYSGLLLKQSGANRLLVSSVNDNHGSITPGTAQFWNFANGPTVFATNNAERMRLTATGSLGVGTINPADRLSVVVDDAVTNGITQSFSLGHTTSGTPAAGMGSSFGFRAKRSDGALAQLGYIGAVWEDPTNGVEDGALVFAPVLNSSGFGTERMRIASWGGVGIGTSTPTGLLSLKVSAGDVIQAFTNAGGTGGEIHIRYKYESSQHRIGWTDSFGNWMFYSQYAPSNINSVGYFPGKVGIGNSSPIYSLDVNGGVNSFRAKAATVSSGDAIATFENNSGVQLIVRGNGFVGLGTPTPGYKLHVEGGSINASGGLCINGDCKTAWSQVGGGGSSQWNDGTNSINYTAGNVGIGTPTPSSLLQVQSAQPDISLNHTNTANYSRLLFKDNGTERSAFQYIGSTFSVPDRRNAMEFFNNYGPVIFYTHTSGPGTERLRIDPSGKVGIGTPTPSKSLDVVGDINASGTIEGGNIKAKYQDVAEWVESSQELAAGTVVVLDANKSNQVVAATRAYDSRVAGVISLRPGIQLGEAGEGRVLVATSGRVKVKVDATSGPIRIGDLLVTSGRDGFAMKSLPVRVGGTRIHRPGTLIGKALEPLAQGTGEILVLLSMQ